jgi:hypothetical protein
MDLHVLTLSYAIFGMEVSLLVHARGPLCRDALVVGAGVGAVPAVIWPSLLDKSSNDHQLTSLKVTSAVVLPSADPEG